MSIELARNGYHVSAFDISSACIEEAEQVLASNPYKDNFGSLDYKVMALHEATGQYDVVLFSVSLHHIPDLEGAVKKSESPAQARWAPSLLRTLSRQMATQ